VTGLQWKDIDMDKGHAWIHPDEAKAKKAIPVPLNENAMSVLRAQLGTHPTHVFTYKGNTIQQCNTKAWKNALDRAGIENFRWHDLRHTWASWHVQMEQASRIYSPFGWSSFEMVLRYAHLSSDHLRSAANRIGHMSNFTKCSFKEVALNVCYKFATHSFGPFENVT
jgi:integrase